MTQREDANFKSQAPNDKQTSNRKFQIEPFSNQKPEASEPFVFRRRLLPNFTEHSTLRRLNFFTFQLLEIPAPLLIANG